MTAAAAVHKVFLIFPDSFHSGLILHIPFGENVRNRCLSSTPNSFLRKSVKLFESMERPTLLFR